MPADKEPYVDTNWERWRGEVSRSLELMEGDLTKIEKAVGEIREKMTSLEIKYAAVSVIISIVTAVITAVIVAKIAG
jgi:hypothetical protein